MLSEFVIFGLFFCAAFDVFGFFAPVNTGTPPICKGYYFLQIGIRAMMVTRQVCQIVLVYFGFVVFFDFENLSVVVFYLIENLAGVFFQKLICPEHMQMSRVSVRFCRADVIHNIFGLLGKIMSIRISVGTCPLIKLADVVQ